VLPAVRLLGDPGAVQHGWQKSRAGEPETGVLRMRLYRAHNSAGVSAVWNDASHTIYALDGARSRAYIASDLIVASAGEAALAALDRLHVPGTDAVVEADRILTSIGGTTTILDDAPGFVAIKTSTSAPGLLVLDEGFGDGGWRAEVDGIEQRVLRVNYLFQGVQVPAGEHSVHFYYWPISVTFGIVISVVALVLIGFFLLGWRPASVPGRHPVWYRRIAAR
jgi:hypothetical protein